MAETLGLVVGVNKVLLGRWQGEHLRIVRSADTSLGDHYLDPTGTGDVLDDGRAAWCAQLEEGLLADLIGRGPESAPRVPSDLPLWANDRPAMRPSSATTLADLRLLRRDLGDDTVGAFARYVRVGGDHGPVCLGVRREPATWRQWSWSLDGQPCRVAIVDESGGLDASLGTGRVHQVETIRDVFRRWLGEHDPTVAGPHNGLRHVVPVRSHPALVEIVGRSGETAGEIAGDDPVVYGTLSANGLLAQAASVGSGLLTDRGVPARTAKRITRGHGRPKPSTVARLAAALYDSPPERHCGYCDARLRGRIDKRYCDASCRQAARRALTTLRTPQEGGNVGNPRTPPLAVAGIDRTIELLSTLPGLRSGLSALATLQRSPKLPSAVRACLSAGATPEQVVERVGLVTSLRGRSPVGILVSQLEELAPVFAAEAEERHSSAQAAVRGWGRRLGVLVSAGELPDAHAALSVIEAEEPDPQLRALAIDAFQEVCLATADSR